jgi:hypothetical protein
VDVVVLVAAVADVVAVAVDVEVAEVDDNERN